MGAEQSACSLLCSQNPVLLVAAANWCDCEEISCNRRALSSTLQCPCSRAPLYHWWLLLTVDAAAAVVRFIIAVLVNGKESMCGRGRKIACVCVCVCAYAFACLRSSLVLCNCISQGSNQRSTALRLPASCACACACAS